MFVETVFKSPFCLSYVLFAASSTLYHVSVTVNVVLNLSCLFSSKKRVVSSFVSYVIACEAVSSAFV